MCAYIKDPQVSSTSKALALKWPDLAGRSLSEVNEAPLPILLVILTLWDLALQLFSPSIDVDCVLLMAEKGHSLVDHLSSGRLMNIRHPTCTIVNHRNSRKIMV